MNRNSKIVVVIAVTMVAACVILILLTHSTVKKTRVSGFDRNDVTAANFRWALFEEWVKGHPQYKDWESDPKIFKMANEDFRKSLKTNVEVIK